MPSVEQETTKEPKVGVEGAWSIDSQVSENVCSNALLFFPGFAIFKLDDQHGQLCWDGLKLPNGWVGCTSQNLGASSRPFGTGDCRVSDSTYCFLMFSVHFMTGSEGSAGWKKDIWEILGDFFVYLL